MTKRRHGRHGKNNNRLKFRDIKRQAAKKSKEKKAVIKAAPNGSKIVKRVFKTEVEQLKGLLIKARSDLVFMGKLLSEQERKLAAVQAELASVQGELTKLRGQVVMDQIAANDRANAELAKQLGLPCSFDLSQLETGELAAVWREEPDASADEPEDDAEDEGDDEGSEVARLREEIDFLKGCLLHEEDSEQETEESASAEVT